MFSRMLITPKIFIIFESSWSHFKDKFSLKSIFPKKIYYFKGYCSISIDSNYYPSVTTRETT